MIKKVVSKQLQTLSKPYPNVSLVILQHDETFDFNIMGLFVKLGLTLQTMTRNEGSLDCDSNSIISEFVKIIFILKN